MGLSVRPVKTQRLGEEDRHLPSRQVRVGTEVAAAAAARDARRGERLDVRIAEVAGGNVAERRRSDGYAKRKLGTVGLQLAYRGQDLLRSGFLGDLPVKAGDSQF